MNLDMTSLLKYLFKTGHVPPPSQPAVYEEELKNLDQGTELKEWKPRSTQVLSPPSPRAAVMQQSQPEPLIQPPVPALGPALEGSGGPSSIVPLDPRSRAHAAFTLGYIATKLNKYAGAIRSQSTDEVTHLCSLCSSGVVPG